MPGVPTTSPVILIGWKPDNATECCLLKAAQTRVPHLRSEALTVVKMPMLVFWVVKFCGPLHRYQLFGGKYNLHLEGYELAYLKFLMSKQFLRNITYEACGFKISFKTLLLKCSQLYQNAQTSCISLNDFYQRFISCNF
jgi:hypothetical protein